ncbi:NADH dehydrogenase [Erythrobacter sp. NAP1]|nr:NADH dehydrogenase [Erythrobacter sp. NAP1]
MDVAGLALRAGASLVEGRCALIDPDARRVETDAGERVKFDIASLDTGGVGQASDVLGKDPRLIDIRPIQGFVERMDALGPSPRIAVIGGGAGGVELAFALRNRAGFEKKPQVALVAGTAGLLPEFSSSVRKTALEELSRQSIVLVQEDARIDENGLYAGGEPLEPVDTIVAAIGSAAPDWVKASGLAVDEAGFAAIDQHQRSLSHPHIFAVGDVAARQDRHVPHSGVHAVFAGPVLAANLRAVMAGRQPRETYVPRWNNIYLLSTGDGRAIASYGRLSAKGRWVSRLKHFIDMRWLRKYAGLAGGSG